MKGLNDDIRQTMARNQEILELKRLGRRNYRLTELKAQHRRETLLTAFEYDSRGAWFKLTEREKQEKEYVVKALSCGTFLNPWNDYHLHYREAHFPQQFLEDRDAVLAYVSQKDFQKKFRSSLFEVPESLRDDREVILEVCRKNSKALSVASERLKDDWDVVMAALQEGSSHCLDQFEYVSPRLRRNKDLVRVQMEMACRDDEENFNSLDFLKHAELSTKDEKQLALECMNLLKITGNSSIFLNYCSTALKDDKDVMMRFIEDDSWWMLEYCSERLRACDEVVNAAVSQSSKALRYSLRETDVSSFTVLTNDKDKVVEYLDEGGSLHGLPNDMKTEPEVILKAIRKGYIGFDDIPVCFHEQKAYILAAVDADPEANIYSRLPNHLQNDQELCIEMMKLGYAGAKDMFDNIPELYRSRDAILAAIPIDFEELDQVVARCPFHDDNEVMLEACLRDSLCLELLSDRLISDNDFMRDLILKSSCCAPLLHTSDDFHIQNIDVVAKVIKRCDLHESILLLDDGQLADDVWNNRLVVLEAIKKGWKVLDKVEPGSPLLEDAELVRLAIKECGPSELRYASLTLRNDHDFIHSVANISGQALYHAPDWALQDDDILTTAIANDPCTILACFDGLGVDEDFETVVELASRVRARLELHDTFVRVFLCGIAIVTAHQSPATRCYLPRLDKGFETTITFKKSIAEYLGVPMKEEIHRLRVASTNLSKFGY
jgi:hypothetical protein